MQQATYPRPDHDPQEIDQSGMTITCGVEIVARVATLEFQESCTILSINPCTGRDHPGGDPLRYKRLCKGALKAAVSYGRTCNRINPARSWGIAGLQPRAPVLQRRLAETLASAWHLGTSIHRGHHGHPLAREHPYTALALLAGGTTLDDLSETELEEVTATHLKIIGSDMRMVGVPVGTGTFQRQSVAEVMRGDSAELLLTLVPMDDAQITFQIMRLSAITRMTFVLRTLPSSVQGLAQLFDPTLY